MVSTKGTAEPDGQRPGADGDEPLLEVRGLTKHFPARKSGLLSRGWVRAVDNVSFSLAQGETIGLVGESGSGKSTTARLILRLLDPSSGEISFDGVDLLACRGKRLKSIRKRMQIVFQDPLGSLNPRATVLDTIGEPLEVHNIASGRQKARRVEELLETTGLSGRDLHKYPHQFSGGQLQRIGIARALATEPEILVCDEAVSSLDVSVQAQVLNLLRDLQSQLGLAYIFIAHDLNVVRYMADEICVMYLGEMVERGDGETIFTDPQHPYTQALLAAVSSPDPVEARQDPRALLQGEIPNPRNPPSGCRFHPRCPYTFLPCSTEVPKFWEVGPQQQAACHLHDPRGRAVQT